MTDKSGHITEVSELINILNSDTMKALENLPNYDIFSKASDFEQADVDKKYYHQH